MIVAFAVAACGNEAGRGRAVPSPTSGPVASPTTITSTAGSGGAISSDVVPTIASTSPTPTTECCEEEYVPDTANIVYTLSRTDVVVAASAVSTLPYALGTVDALRGVQIEVRDLLWSNPAALAEPILQRPLPEPGPLLAADIRTLDAGFSTTGDLLVGLVLVRDALLAEIGADYVVSFVATVAGDGMWRFQGRHASELDSQYRAVLRVLPAEYLREAPSEELAIVVSVVDLIRKKEGDPQAQAVADELYALTE